uniref:Reverse transcriptase domain-containing protein n=1 Tax=Tanacetum cinerariifolium TaxID=118510 RepID=A0A6L2LJ18_TANCI|nr:hypothetical protein [Tanacetum cinerariifolium]
MTPLRIDLSVETRLMVVIVKDVLFNERNLRKICLRIVLKMEFSKTFKILPSHPMTIPTLLMLFKSHSLSNKTPVKIPHKVLHKSTTIVVTVVVILPIIPDLEPFNNQTLDELPQTLLSFDPTCHSEDGNSFTYDFKSNLVDDSPNVFNPPPQTPTYSYEFCSDAYYGHDCSLQFPVIYKPIREKTCAELLAEEQEANISIQQFQYSSVPKPPREEISVEFLQEKRNQIHSVKTFLRKFNQISFYEMPKSWDRPTICYNDDDDEDYTIAITLILSTEEPDNSLRMGDEHLDTISAPESDEFIKSSVENLVSIPSESEGVTDNMCDVPFHDNSPPLDISKDQFEEFSDSNDDYTSIDDDSIDNIEYVEASPPDSEIVSLEVMEIVLPKVGWIDDDILLTIKDDILQISSCSTITCSDISLLDYEAFYDDHVKEFSSGSTTTHSDSSLYDSFIFDLSINLFLPAGRSDFYHEEFADELAHIISSPEYDCSALRMNPTRGILLWMWWRIFFQQEFIMFYPPIPPFN